MHSWKLMLTALGTGALLGTIGGTTLSPTLKPPPDQPWRQALGQQGMPVATYAIADAPPQDLAPLGWTYGAGRAFPEEIRRGARRSIGYRYDDAPTPAEADEPWSYAAMSDDAPAPSPGRAMPAEVEVPAADAVEAAEAARDAARDVADQGLQPVVPAETPSV